MPISKFLAELDINKPKRMILEKIASILKFQFGKPVFKKLLENESEISIEFSKNTGRIKNLLYKGQRILTYKPSVGQFNLSLQGAMILRKNFPPPHFRVKIMDDVQDFIKQGKSVFAKHILEIDKDLRLGNEVIVVNESDEFIAVGKLTIPPFFHHGRSIGVAVMVRKGIKK